MTKYGDQIDDDHWESNEPEGPPAWREDTSAPSIEIDVQLHDQGYQTDEKWTINCSARDGGLVAGYAIEHQNKGNYWRHGEQWGDAVDFVDLPLRVRQRVAHVLNRDLDEITPDERSIYREDGTGLGDRAREEEGRCEVCGGKVFETTGEEPLTHEDCVGGGSA
jgi:hypothetical protein